MNFQEKWHTLLTIGAIQRLVRALNLKHFGRKNCFIGDRLG
jgi:hypothetical protein